MEAERLHPMERWRIANGIPTKAAAAARLGMTPQQYGDITAGRTEPSAARMRQILEEAEGQITAEELVGWKAAS